MYLTPADRERWEIVDRIAVLDVLAEQRARIVELEGLVRFREFERDQAWRALEACR